MTITQPFLVTGEQQRGSPWRVVAGGERTGGLVTIGDARARRARPAAWRIHSREDEAIYVTSGVLTVEVEASTTERARDGWCGFPAVSSHTFANLSDEPVWTVGVITPWGWRKCSPSSPPTLAGLAGPATSKPSSPSTQSTASGQPTAPRSSTAPPACDAAHPSRLLIGQGPARRPVAGRDRALAGPAWATAAAGRRRSPAGIRLPSRPGRRGNLRRGHRRPAAQHRRAAPAPRRLGRRPPRRMLRRLVPIAALRGSPPRGWPPALAAAGDTASMPAARARQRRWSAASAESCPLRWRARRRSR